MIRRTRLLVVVLLTALTLVACSDDPEADTTKDTLSDPLGDIVALHGQLYATNNDRSGNAGSQVDLFVFGFDGFPADRHDLGLNHTGFLAAAADEEFVYLQARDTGRLYRASPVGEIDWVRDDPVTGGDVLACGITHRADVDSFVVVYRQSGTTTYTTLQYGPGFDGPASEPQQDDWSDFGTDPGVRAVAWASDALWALGIDPDGQAMIQGFPTNGGSTRIITLPDDSACGLTATTDTLWVAYPDRRFESIDISEGSP